LNFEQISIEDLMIKSSVAFGTSGARGLVSAMSDQVCYSYTRGFLGYLASLGDWHPGQQVALAGDLRSSTPRILAACAQAIEDLGGEPIFCGYVPTPAMALWAFKHKMPSIMVTGSHIPDDRNGIKFYRSNGEILKQDELGIKQQKVPMTAPEVAPLPIESRTKAKNVNSEYIQRYVDFFGPDVLKNRKIGVYQHSAVGRDILVEVLQALGAEVVSFGRSDLFIPVDTEAVRSEDVELAASFARTTVCDAIVSTDGDSDRPLLADHTGEWIRGDVLGVICAKALEADSVVTPVSSSTIVEKCNFFRKVIRTQIGSPYVIAAMNDAISNHDGRVCGYEANGGFLLGTDIHREGKVLTALPTRDAFLPIIMTLSAAGHGTIRDMINLLPNRTTHSDRIANFGPERQKALMNWLNTDIIESRHKHDGKEFSKIADAALISIDQLDGIRMKFANERIIHLRPSGNAPELRCYSEAEDEFAARLINEKTMNLIQQRF
jgi:phosphomannomutase